MQFIKLAVCISALVTNTCFAAIIEKTPEHDKSSLLEASINILESCYADRFSTVGLAGPSVASIMTEILSRDTVIPVTLIDGASSLESHNPLDRGSLYKLQIFLITTTDQKSLFKTLQEIRKTKWWNHMASFLFIGLNESGDGCSTATAILYGAWLYDLLKSKFMCLHQTRGRLLYTFNPYTSKAPVPWQQEVAYGGPDFHIWTLFVREYREDESRCDELDFDKTIDLGGYEIRATSNGMEWWGSEDKMAKRWLQDRIHNVTLQILMSSINATWTVQIQPLAPYVMLNSYLNETYGPAADVTNGYSDFMLNLAIQHPYKNFDTTEQVLNSKILFFTQYPRNKSQLEKLISVLDRRSRVGVFVVLMITLLFFKFCLGKPLVPSIMDLVLLVCNTGIQRVPQRTFARIYLAGLFILVVTIQGIYSGQFASLLTKDVRLRTIDTMEDLARSNYKIYGPHSYRVFFYDKRFEGRYLPMGNSGCLEDVLRDPEAACVADEAIAYDLANFNRLHVARESVGYAYDVFLIRPNWPLEERVNKIYQRAKASGLMETLYSRQRDSVIGSLKSYENHEEDPEVKVLTLEQLSFAFAILGIGLGCATIVFIIEVIIGKAIGKPRGRIRR